MRLLTIIFIILLVAWLLGGFVFPVGGSLIHLVLVIAVIVLLFDIIGSRRL